MKKVISSLTIAAVMTFGVFNVSYAQDSKTAETAVTKSAKEGTTSAADDAKEEVQLDFVQVLKQKYIEGDPLWMTPVLICLIIGVALAIERVVYLNLATINTTKFVGQVEDALKSGGVDSELRIAIMSLN